MTNPQQTRQDKIDSGALYGFYNSVSKRYCWVVEVVCDKGNLSNTKYRKRTANIAWKRFKKKVGRPEYWKDRWSMRFMKEIPAEFEGKPKTILSLIELTDKT